MGVAGPPGPQNPAGQICHVQAGETSAASPIPECGHRAAADPTGPSCPIAPTLAKKLPC